jgi:hypothetical protein
MDWAALLQVMGPFADLVAPEFKTKVFNEIMDNATLANAPRERKPMKQELFTVYKVDNGFLGETMGGGIVVGASMSEVCSAAQAQVAASTILAGDDGDVPTSATNPLKKASWQRLSKP